MHLIIGGFFIIAYLLLQYLLSRTGLVARPYPPDRLQYTYGLAFLSFVGGWTRKTRVIGRENIPRAGPAIFAENHVQLTDPFVAGDAIHWNSDRKLCIRAMMRNDFFGKLPAWTKKIFDLDDVATIVGAILINRKQVEQEQLQPFLDLLLQGKAFSIYPGRSRTRSGTVFEYRDWIRSPGATSFFVGEVQALKPEVKVPVIPVMRTPNPATGRSVVIFGKAMYMAPTLDRAERREFDYDLIVAIAQYVELHVPHALALVFYLRALHGISEKLAIEDARLAARAILKGSRHPYIDPAVNGRFDQELDRSLRFFEKHRAISRKGNEITISPETILAAPPIDDHYRYANPVKFLVNQVMHLPKVIDAAEQVVLGR